jgi:hypothetical protein
VCAVCVRVRARVRVCVEPNTHVPREGDLRCPHAERAVGARQRKEDTGVQRLERKEATAKTREERGERIQDSKDDDDEVEDIPAVGPEFPDTARHWRLKFSKVSTYRLHVLI